MEYFLLGLFIFLLILRFIINKPDNTDITNNNQTIEENKNSNIKEYKLAGVTYKNEDNKDIQKEIKKILREYINEGIIDKEDMFLGYTNSDIKDMAIEVSQYEDITFNAKLKEDIFENKPCVKVYIERADGQTYTHIGYIPKRYNQIQEVIDILNNYNNIKLNLYIVGGKIKECQIDYDDDYNEKFYVETTELDYGFRLFIEYK